MPAEWRGAVGEMKAAHPGFNERWACGLADRGGGTAALDDSDRHESALVDGLCCGWIEGWTEVPELEPAAAGLQPGVCGGGSGHVNSGNGVVRVLERLGELRGVAGSTGDGQRAGVRRPGAGGVCPTPEG